MSETAKQLGRFGSRGTREQHAANEALKKEIASKIEAITATQAHVLDDADKLTIIWGLAALSVRALRDADAKQLERIRSTLRKFGVSLCEAEELLFAMRSKKKGSQP